MYLATGNIPDLAFAVSVVSQKLDNASVMLKTGIKSSEFSSI